MNGVKRKLKNNQGMTLLEVIIAVAILGIIAAVFLNSFSTGFINIFNMGNRTKAMLQAQTILDRIHESGSPTPEHIQSIVTGAQEYMDIGDVDPSTKVWFQIG